MATFYLLPSRLTLGQHFSDYLSAVFPGLSWKRSVWPDLAEALVREAGLKTAILTRERAMSDSNQPAVTSYLTVKGGLDAIAFYQRAFGAELLSQEMDDDGRRVAHAALDVFGTMIMLSDEFPEYDLDSKSPRTVLALIGRFRCLPPLKL